MECHVGVLAVSHENSARVVYDAEVATNLRTLNQNYDARSACTLTQERPTVTLFLGAESGCSCPAMSASAVPHLEQSECRLLCAAISWSIGHWNMF